MPCKFWTGAPRPDEGSGSCTGNWITTIELPTVGLTLVHNSEAQGQISSFGRQWNVNIDRTFASFTGSADGIAGVMTGGGDLAYYVKIPDTNRWETLDSRVSKSTFTLVGEVLTETNVSGQTATYEPILSPSGSGAIGYSVKELKDRYGNTVTFTRDATGNIERISNSFSSSTIEFTLETLYGKKFTTAIRDGNGNDYSFNYDEYGRLRKVNFPNATSTTLTYDRNSAAIETVLTPDGETYEMAYYLGGAIRAVKNPYSYVTEMRYTANSVTVTGPKGATTETFNDQGFISTVKHKNATASYIYDSDGRYRLARYIDILGRETRFAYKGITLYPATITHSDGSTQNFTYDTNYNLATHTSQLGTSSKYTVFTATPYPAVTSIKENNLDTAITTFGYDPKGNLINTKSPSGMTTWSGTYLPNGDLKTSTDVNGLTTTYDYLNGSVASVIGPLGHTTTYDYDGVGNLMKVASSQFTTEYTYDGMGTAMTSSTNGGAISSSQDISRRGNGLLSQVTSTQKINGANVFVNSTVYDPAIPFRTVSETINNSRGEEWNLLTD